MPSKLFRNYLPEFFALGLGRSKPNKVGINLTNRCNQHCIYCEIGKGTPEFKESLLTVDDLIWIIDEMAANNMRRLSLCGGEPFLFKGIIEVVAYAGEKNIRCAITSNGMTIHMLDENELDVLKKCNAEINISVDSFRESIQSYTRGSSSALTNAIMSIQRLHKKKIPVTVLTVISKYNYHDLFQSFVAAYSTGVRQLLFQPVITYSNYPEHPAVDNKNELNVGADQIEELLAELKKILDFEKNHAIKTNVYRIMPWIKHYLNTTASNERQWFFDKVLEKFYCRDIYALIEITYNGEIMPCGLAPASVNIYNDRQKGLLGLWMDATKEIKDDLINGRYRDYCNGCCHHFSRNMLASIIKYPFRNRKALLKIIPLLGNRLLTRTAKKIIFVQTINQR
jgi:MoaA/NifB/PqqE/SkfB family radical SAM enzyme